MGCDVHETEIKTLKKEIRSQILRAGSAFRRKSAAFWVELCIITKCKSCRIYAHICIISGRFLPHKPVDIHVSCICGRLTIRRKVTRPNYRKLNLYIKAL